MFVGASMRNFLRRLFHRHTAEERNASLAEGWNEERFSQLIAGVQDYAVILLDHSGKVISWNAGAERIKGYQANEIIGRNFCCFYPKELQASGWPERELAAASETGRFEDEGWRIRKDGTRFWANVVITAIRNDKGELNGFLKITRDLTERHQAEQTLKLSEERFRLIVEGVKDYAIFMLDTEGRVATWSSGAERIKGYRAEEIIGRHFSQFYPPDAIARDWPNEELRRAVADGRIEDEGWRIRKDGSRFWANVVITALRDGHGILRGFTKVTRDLTERRQAEENARQLQNEEVARKAAEKSAHDAQLAREEERRHRAQLQVTLNSIGDGVIVTDHVGRVTFLNPIAMNLTGWSSQDAAGLPIETIFNIVNEGTRKPVENPVTKVLKEGIVVGLANHTILIARDGREFPIDDSGAPIFGEDGTLSGVVLVFRDVTEAKRAAAARLHLASIVESSDDAIIGHSLDGIIQSWNRGAENLYGYQAEEIIGQSLQILIPPNHPDELPQNLQRLVNGEHLEHFETERVRKDGSRVDVSLTISPIRNASGEIIGASKIARDISGRKEEDRQKNEFLAMLAHELRNPLAAILSGVEVLRMPGSDEEESNEILTIISRQTLHLVRLVDDLIDISRITRGTLELRKENLTLTEAVKQAIEMCSSTVQERQQHLHVKLPDGECLLLADKTRLAQAICNLITNASKYSGRGSPIWLTAKREGSEAVISIKDSGVGIPQSLLPKVFDMFFQLKQATDEPQKGIGVGLAIVKRLVELHGGTVEGYSDGPGLGSEFRIRLPLVVRETPEADSVQVPSQKAESETGVRVLVVDDNHDAANLLSRALRRLGHEVLTAYNGQNAIDAIVPFQPDAVFLDLGMPTLDGFETCQRIREIPLKHKLYIAALTGWGQSEDRIRTQAAGFDHHLVKPVEPLAVHQILQQLQQHA